MISAIFPMLFFTCFIASFIALLAYWFNYSAHKEMTIRNSETWDYGSFSDFKREFYKHKWTFEESFPESLFADGHKTEIHAGIVRFNKKGMVLRGTSFIRFGLFIKKYLKDNNKRSKGMWDQKHLRVVK